MTIMARGAFLACLGVGAGNAQSLPELHRVISEQLLYPREARYTIPASLPSNKADAAKNAEWMAVAERLSKAGLIRSRQVSSGKIVLDSMEQSLDVAIPSTNLRYETTALNLVLGRWEIDVQAAARAADATVVQGRRRLAARTRIHGLVVDALPAKAAAGYSDREAVWEITGHGASLQVAEKIK